MARVHGPTITSLINQLIHTQEGNLSVNDEIVPKKLGTKTESGYYKNGWKFRDVKGDGKFMQLNIYTVRDGEVVYEHQMMFKRKRFEDFSSWSLVVLKGFDDVDLLKVDTPQNSEKYVIEYLFALLKRAVADRNEFVDSVLAKYC